MTQPSRFLTIANPALALLVEVDTAITGHAAVFISDGTDTVQVDPAHLSKLTAALVEAQQAIAGDEPRCRCGKPTAHLEAPIDSDDWACRGREAS